MTRALAVTPLTDITTWLRGRGLEIVLLVLGAVLLARLVTWCGRRVTERMDRTSTDVDALVRVERQCGYGDLVHISAVGFEGATGTIEEVALRTTRLRTLTGDVVTISNGLIVGVTNLSRGWARALVDVPLPLGWTWPGPTTCSARSARTRSRTTPCGPCCWTPRL